MNTARVPETVFQGVPTFFRAACFEAKQGGENGYYGTGWALLHNLSTLVEGDSDADQQAKLGELAVLLDDQSDESAVLDWFKREFPRCMALVPTRRRGRFVKGAFESWDNEGHAF